MKLFQCIDFQCLDERFLEEMYDINKKAHKFFDRLETETLTEKERRGQYSLYAS